MPNDTLPATWTEYTYDSQDIDNHVGNYSIKFGSPSYIQGSATKTYSYTLGFASAAYKVVTNDDYVRLAHLQIAGSSKANWTFNSNDDTALISGSLSFTAPFELKQYSEDGVQTVELVLKGMFRSRETAPATPTRRAAILWASTLARASDSSATLHSPRL